MEIDNGARPTASTLTVSSRALALVGLVFAGLAITRLVYGASLAVGSPVEWLAFSVFARVAPDSWQIPEWVIPALGLAGLIGTGLDLTAWRNLWGRTGGRSLWLALVITLVSLLTSALGFLEISRLAVHSDGWALRSAGGTIGGILSATAGLSAFSGWWRLLKVNQGAFSAYSQRHSLEDGLRCIGQGVVLVVLLGVLTLMG